jgi:hypothetical protein
MEELGRRHFVKHKMQLTPENREGLGDPRWARSAIRAKTRLAVIEGTDGGGWRRRAQFPSPTQNIAE